MKWWPIAVIFNLVLATSALAEQLYAEENEKGELVFSIGKPIIHNPTPEQEVVVVLPARKACQNFATVPSATSSGSGEPEGRYVTVNLQRSAVQDTAEPEGQYVTVTLPKKAVQPGVEKKQARAALPGEDKVEADVWGGHATASNANGTYVGGRLAYRPIETAVGGADLKVGPYVGAGHWEGKTGTWAGQNSTVSTGISSNLAGDNTSLTVHGGVRYQDSEGSDKGGRYRSDQYDFGPEVYAEINTRNQNQNWLKRTTVFGQGFFPVHTTQHNSWDGKANKDKPTDNTRISVGVNQDIYTTDESPSGMQYTVGAGAQLGHAYGGNDTMWSIGPYVRATVNGKDIIRIGFLTPEFHSKGSNMTRIFDASLSFGGVVEGIRNINSRSVPPEEAHKR